MKRNSRSSRWFRRSAITQVSFLGLALIYLTSCGKPLAETPIEHQTTIVDLIAESVQAGEEMRRKAMAERLEARASIPESSHLKVQGRIWKVDPKAEATTGVVRFIVEADGEVLVDHPLESEQRSARFELAVDLPHLADREVEFMLRLERSEPDRGYAEWQRVTVEQTVPVARQTAEQGRNLLFVVVDTWRADHCSLYGYERPTTPGLEALAEDSLVFDDAISQSSWTAPAVASLMTGLYPTQHGVVHGEPLHPTHKTLQEHLQGAGLTTYAVSTNPLIGPNDGYAQGVETFEHIPWERADEVNLRFLDWLDGKEDLRWGAYLHYMDPHDPYDAPPPAGEAFVDLDYQGLFRQEKALNELFHTVNFGAEPAHEYTDEDIEFLKASYDGEILFWDQKFAELIATLRERGLLERTVIVITSDHGEEFVEHGMFKHGHQLYDESVRVPLIIRAPGRLESGRRSAQVETRGLLRAALQLLNLDDFPSQPNDLLKVQDGDRFPAFSHTIHQPAPDQPRRPLVASVRDTSWKLIRWFEKKTEHLYNLDDDPGETVDQRGENGELANQYHDILIRWLDTNPAENADDRPPLDPELEERLRALGYIQ